MKKISLRKRFYLAVEGEGERSFIKWLQMLSEQNGLHIHLDCQLLDGGGYKSMLNKALRCRKQKDRSTVKAILVVDADRAERDDGWSIADLKQEASKREMHVSIQSPNQEGLLLRMLPGKEDLQPLASTVKKQLSQYWPEYSKPIETRMLASKFSLEDLVRVAKKDSEIKELLQLISCSRY
jgi:hypothetical protein